jgi:hypothetical protein
LSNDFNLEWRLLGFEDFLGKVVSDSVAVEVDVEVMDERLAMDEREVRVDCMSGAIPLAETGFSSES